MNRRMYALMLVLMIPGPAAAQTPAPVGTSASAAASNEPLPRWDTAGFLGWRGVRIQDTEYNYERWDARFVYGATAGYYWTTNVKLEVDFSGTAPSRYYTYEQHFIEGVTYPLFVNSDHRTVTASLGGLVIYQFFENASFHPFLGAGARWMTARDRITTQRQSQVIRRTPDGPYEVVVISQAETRNHTDNDARAQMIAGFKAYPGERLFFRTDVQWSVGSGRFRDVALRIGVGVDF